MRESVRKGALTVWVVVRYSECRLSYCPWGRGGRGDGRSLAAAPGSGESILKKEKSGHHGKDVCSTQNIGAILGKGLLVIRN